MMLPRQIRNKPARLVALLFSLVLSIALVFSAYGGMMNPLNSSVGAVAAMMFPIMLCLQLLVLIVNLLWFRVSAAVTGVALLVCAGPIFTYCPLNFFRPSVRTIERNPENVVKIMTYNMLNLDDFSKGFCSVDDGNPTVGYILREAPDILFCQEGNPVLSENEKNITPEQHRELIERYPYRNVNQRGMGVLSRFPVKVTTVKHPDRWLYDVYRYEIEVKGMKIVAFNLHLQSLGLTPDDKALYHDLTSAYPPDDLRQIRTSLIGKLTAAFRQRACQAAFIREAIDREEGTVIVCGDFNDIPGCYAQRVIQGDDLSDAYREAGLGPAITYHADRFFFRIDHILYRGNLEPLRVWAGHNTSSDHYPLIAYFKISNNKPQ